MAAEVSGSPASLDPAAGALDDPLIQDGGGNYPLHLAVGRAAPPEIVLKLLQSDADAAKRKNDLRETPLHVATSGGAPLAVVQLLLFANPAAVEERDVFKRLPLHCAALSGRAEVVRELLIRHPEGLLAADEDLDLPLHSAARCKSPHCSDVVAALLAQAPQAAAETNLDRQLPLHVAVLSKPPDTVVAALLRAYPEAARAPVSPAAGDVDLEEYRDPVKHEGLLPLHLAVAVGASLPVVQLLLEQYEAAAQVPSKRGQLPIHLAACARAEEGIVSALLAANPDGANQTDGQHLPLHCALIHAAPTSSILAVLNASPAAAGVEAGGGDGKQRLPLHLAAVHAAGSEVVEALLAADREAAGKADSEGAEPLHYAAGSCAAAVVRPILQACPAAAQHRDAQGLLPLHHAARGGAALDVVELLLGEHPDAAGLKDNRREFARGDSDSGSADDEDKDELAGGERLALHWALRGGAAPPVVDALLRAYPGAVAEPDQHGNLPLHCACQGQAPEGSVAMVLNAAAVRAGNHTGELPLHLAAGCNAPPAVVRALLAAFGVAVRTPDNEGRLPLHAAAGGSASAAVLQQLLDAHEQAAGVEDNAGLLPLHLAVDGRASPEGAVELLLKYNPRAASARDPHGYLPLHIAACSEAPASVVRALLGAYPAAASQADKHGDLPLHWAAKNAASPEVVRLLLEANAAAASQLGRFDELPLHMTQEEDEVASDVIAMLVRAHPLALVAEDQYGRLPLEWSLGRAPAAVVESTAQMEYSAAAALAWHGVVAVSACAELVGGAVRGRPELAKWPDASQRSAFDAACVECRDAIRNALYFIRRYEIVREVHRSATCLVYLATDSREDGMPVALKLMFSPRHFRAEIRTREESALSPEHVVGWIRAHVDPAAEGTEALADMQQQVGDRLQTGLSFGPRAVVEHNRVPYGYCLVMVQAEKSLSAALIHNRFAGLDWQMVRKIGADLLQALSHMHCRQVSHCDVKPLNVMHAGHRWRLIDLDTACRHGEAFGCKAPSSGYVPPEMAAAMLEAGYGAPGGGDLSQLSAYRAGVAHDLWGVGAVLYYMACAYPLWQMTTDDDVDGEDLRSLASWDTTSRNRRLVRGGIVQTHPVMCDLLVKLLEPDPAVRAGHWEPGMECESVLQHSFFKENRDVDRGSLGRQMEEILETVRRVDAKVGRLEAGQQDLAAMVEQSLRLLTAQKAMMKEMIKGVHDVPSYSIFLPEEPGDDGLRGWIQKLQSPTDSVQHLFNHRVKLHFVCALTYEIDSVGFSIQFTRQWVKDAAPFLKAGLTVLKVAAAVGRLYGLPDLAGCVKQAVDSMSSAVDSALGEEAARLFDDVAEAARQVPENGTGVVAAAEPRRLPEHADRIMQRSARELREHLPANWQDRIGLTKAVIPEGPGPRAGATVWCMKELEGIVEEHGLSDDTDYVGLMQKHTRDRLQRAAATSAPDTAGLDDVLLPGRIMPASPRRASDADARCSQAGGKAAVAVETQRAAERQAPSSISALSRCVTM